MQYVQGNFETCAEKFEMLAEILKTCAEKFEMLAEILKTCAEKYEILAETLKTCAEIFEIPAEKTADFLNFSAENEIWHCGFVYTGRE